MNGNVPKTWYSLFTNYHTNYAPINWNC